MDKSLEFSRRTLLKVAGVATLVITFLPKVAMASRNILKSLRTGVQPGGKTRLVIETSSKPSYSLDYLSSPNRLVVNLLNTGGTGLKPSLASNTLIKSISQVQVGDKLQVIANLNKSIAPINKNQIMILEPTGGNGYRLVLDFVAGSGAVKAATTSAATAESANKKTPEKRIIVIDAGHGGKDPGCIGVTGIKEKNIVLSTAKKLRDKLISAGFIVYLTRSTDIFLNLGTRAQFGEKHKADLFVSLHANSNPSHSTKGFSVYTLSKKASDIEAQKLADAENAADKIDVDGFERFEPDIRNALSALQQQAVAEMSVEFADGAVNKLSKCAERQEKPLRSAAFAVLKSNIPSSLIELGHLSNRSEERLLASSNYQDKLADAISLAIKNYNFEE